MHRAGTGSERGVEGGQTRGESPVGPPSRAGVGRVAWSDLTPPHEKAPARTAVSKARARARAACDPSRKTTPVAGTGSEVRTKPPREGKKPRRGRESVAQRPHREAFRSQESGKTLRMGPDERAGLRRASRSQRQRNRCEIPRRFAGKPALSDSESRGRSAALPGGGVRPRGTGWAGARSGWQRLRRSAPDEAGRRSVESAGPLETRSGGV
jgi:hypothetical protein